MTTTLQPRPTADRPAPFVPPVPVSTDHRGVRIVGLDVPGAPFADVRLLWGRGWGDEPPGGDGLVSLTSRVLDGASAVRAPDEFACTVEALGASIGTSASTDAFTLRVHALRDRLLPSLDLALEVLRRPRLEERYVDRLRQESLDRRRRHLADPNRLGAEVLAGALYPDHRYGRPRAGTSEAIRALTAEQVGAYVRERLHPAHATVLVAGDLASLDRDEIAERVLDGAPETPPTAAAPPPAFPQPSGRRVLLVHRPGAVQSVLTLGHVGPARRDPDVPALQLGTGLLGGAFTSRLNLRLREDRGYTYGARAVHETRRHTGTVVVRTAVDAAATAQALQDIDGVVSRLLVYGATPQELDDTRSYRLQLLPQRYETVRGTADTVAAELALGLAPHEVGAIEAALPGVTLEDVDAALARHLRPDDLVTVVVGDADRVRADVAGGDLGEVTVVPDVGA